MSELVAWLLKRIHRQRENNRNGDPRKAATPKATDKKRQRREWMRRYRAKVKRELDAIMRWDSASYFAREKAKKEKRKVAKQVKADKKKGIY